MNDLAAIRPYSGAGAKTAGAPAARRARGRGGEGRAVAVGRTHADGGLLHPGRDRARRDARPGGVSGGVAIRGHRLPRPRGAALDALRAGKEAAAGVRTVGAGQKTAKNNIRMNARACARL